MDPTAEYGTGGRFSTSRLPDKPTGIATPDYGHYATPGTYSPYGYQGEASDPEMQAQLILGYFIMANTTAIPTGTVCLFAGATAPDGWAICNGAAISRVTYAELFAVIASIYGAGDGSTSFNIPDLRGRVGIGSGTGTATDATAHSIGTAGGTEGVTLTAAQSGVPAHTHPDIQATNVGGGASNTLNVSGNGPITGNATGQINANVATGASAAHSNLSPFLTLNYMIKL
jgi:microcystin-dependent protein